jgi:hypothetical protein
MAGVWIHDVRRKDWCIYIETQKSNIAAKFKVSVGDA